MIIVKTWIKCLIKILFFFSPVPSSNTLHHPIPKPFAVPSPLQRASLSSHKRLMLYLSPWRDVERRKIFLKLQKTSTTSTYSSVPRVAQHCLSETVCHNPVGLSCCHRCTNMKRTQHFLLASSCW